MSKDSKICESVDFLIFTSIFCTIGSIGCSDVEPQCKVARTLHKISTASLIGAWGIISIKAYTLKYMQKRPLFYNKPVQLSKFS